MNGEVVAKELVSTKANTISQKFLDQLEGQLERSYSIRNKLQDKVDKIGVSEPTPESKGSESTDPTSFVQEVDMRMRRLTEIQDESLRLLEQLNSFI